MERRNTSKSRIESVAERFTVVTGGSLGDRSKVEARREDILTDRAPESAGVRCSLCSKSQVEVLAMFSGPDDGFICNECIALFVEEVAHRREDW